MGKVDLRINRQRNEALKINIMFAVFKKMTRLSYFLALIVFFSACINQVDKKIDEPPRFFSDDSFWNQPIPEEAVIDPRSDYWISLLERDPSGENFGLNIKSYTIPIYEVDSKNIPFQKLKHRSMEKDFGQPIMQKGHEPEFDSIGVPITPNMLPSPGTDMHVAIIDWEENLAWDMFWVKRLEDGTWVSATGMIYPLDGSGVFQTSDFEVKINESIHGYGPGVAAGMPIIAGVIRYDLVKYGKIRHKLAGALRYVAYQEYVFPASWTDGNFEGGIPEGAVIQLDPSLDLSKFDLTEGEKVVAKALQEYGLVIVDFSVGSTIRAEYLDKSASKSWDGILRGWDEPGGIKSIPVKHYRVLKVENVQKGGDKKKKFFEEHLYFEGDSI
jgi:hypothetical protein